MPLDDTATGQAMDDQGKGEAAPYLAFLNDGATESALQQGMADIRGTLEIRRGGIKAAIAALQHLDTPRVLIVDIAGEDSPLAALEALADIVEPSVCVLVLGDLSGLDF